jgi:hypothetical protein
MRKLFAWINNLVNRLVKNYTLWIFLGLILLGVIAVKAWHFVFPPMPAPPVYGSLHVPNQGWSPARREKFYQTSQGNPVVPLSWFLSLERQPQGFPPRLGEVDLFSSPQVQARYGLLPDTSPYNQYQLPVGLVPDILSGEVVNLLGQGQKVWMGMSCAACHTGQIQYQGRAIRIDGGQAMWNFSQWSSDLVANLTLTAVLPDRFDRFAERVFALEDSQNSENTENTEYSEDRRKALRDSLEVYLNSPLIKDAIDAIVNHTYPNVEGNARTAALGRGVNGEFGLLDPRNIARNHGPVSFPPLWYTHDYDWVQSVAAIRQPMGRNITEAWGVNVQVELRQPGRYISTNRLNDLFWMESLLSVLEAPPWPEEILGRIDPKRVERGRYLYETAVWDQALTPAQEQLPPSEVGMVAPPNPRRPRTGYCARCHAPAIAADAWEGTGYGFVQLPLYRQDVLGTDPYDAEEFNARNPYTGVIAGDLPGQHLNVGAALTGIIEKIQQRWYRDRAVPPDCQTIMNGFRENAFRAPLGYPARPLAGYWATGPFLHNGSVRTLYQLLSPVGKRDKTFYMGSYEFDPRELGYRNERIDGAFLYDTSVKGNSNAGHEFRDAPRGTTGVVGPYLSPEDRRAIIEYMKVMNDVKPLIRPEASAQRYALLDVIRPEYEGKWGRAAYAPATRESMALLCRKVEGFMRTIPPDRNYIASLAPGYGEAPAYGSTGAPAYEYVGAPGYGYPAAPAANGSASQEGREP